MKLPECTYTGVYVGNSDIVYISAVSDELAEENIDHAVILKKTIDGWSFCTLAESLSAVVIDPNLEETTAICIDGAIYSIDSTCDSTCKQKDYVDESDEGPSDLVHLKDAKYIDGNIVVVGMARRVYSCNAQKTWKAIDNGVFVAREHRKEPVGFLAIDGFSADDIYAVGLNGQIWSYDGGSWIQCSSPTNLALTEVLCGKDNYVYIAGLSGVVIIGRGSSWKTITNESTTSDIWGIAEFNGEIYLSNYDGIFKIVNDLIAPVFASSREELTTAYLSSGDDVIYSVGHKDILLSIDGERWSTQTVEEVLNKGSS